MNVRRERHFADVRQQLVDRLKKADEPAILPQILQDLDLGSAFDLQTDTGAHALAANQAFPYLRFDLPEEQQFDPSARGFARVKAGWNDAGLVDDEQITRVEIVC